MNNELYQLLLSLKIGDGCFVNQRKVGRPTYRVMCNSINYDYVDYKANVLNKFGIDVKFYTKCSGYGSTKLQRAFNTHVEPEITIVGRMTIEQILSDLDLSGLILYYLDDGSLHKNKHFMNLYCNSFTYEQTEQLIDVLYKFFPMQRCKHSVEHKKDGRNFNYVYIPVCVAREFSVHIREFLIQNNIDSLLYKTISPSQTIENIE